jgi:hypothetical protein
MSHLVLLGDSTLDNAAYVPAGEDVAAQIRGLVPSGWRVTLGALDGSVIGDVATQLAALPRDATHLVVSVGGNDALMAVDILEAPVRSMAEALGMIARFREQFCASYRTMLDGVLARGLPTAISTIYDGATPDEMFQTSASVALASLNDCITREAVRRRVPIVDLRTIFDREADYANPIEPSAQGGRKLAAAIVDFLTRHDFTAGRTEILSTPALQPV